MNTLRQNGILLFFIILTADVLFWAGCAQPVREPVKICPGKETIAEAIVLLNQRRENIGPIKASGSCRILWYDSENKPHREKLDIKLRFYPPDRLYFKGDVLGIEAVRLGTNREQFWLRIKPKEISAYWWGKRSGAKKCSNQLWINPNNLLEALGVINIDSDWIFSKQGDFDILTRTDPAGNTAKRIYINRCDYLPAKIEYFDDKGVLAVVVALADYTHKHDEIISPTRINMTHEDSDDTKTIVDIRLRNVKLYQPEQKELQGKLFKLPPTKGFENVFILNDNCEFDRQ